MLNKIPSWFFFEIEIVEIVIIPANDFFIELNWSQILKKSPLMVGLTQTKIYWAINSLSAFQPIVTSDWKSWQVFITLNFSPEEQQKTLSSSFNSSVWKSRFMPRRECFFHEIMIATS